MTNKPKRNPYVIAKLIALTDKRAAREYRDLIDYREAVSREAVQVSSE